jgi:CheY-like chemotaxis protein
VSASVLVVDDDHDAAAGARAVLEAHGYDVLTARDGREALELLIALDRLPDLVLLDLVMPGMDGWEFLGLMRTYARLSKIPVILLTGHTPPRQSRPSYAGILHKPVSADALMNAVEQHCPRAA